MSGSSSRATRLRRTPSYVDIDDTCPGNPVCTVTTAGNLSGVFAGANDRDSLFTTDANGFGTERASFPSGFEKADFVVDFGASGTTFLTGDDTTFSTGSKDTLPINLASGADWQCNHDNNVNSKIDIINGYAANYVAGGQKYIFFGLEKDVDNGSNNVGLWLFQDRARGLLGPGRLGELHRPPHATATCCSCPSSRTVAASRRSRRTSGWATTRPAT